MGERSLMRLSTIWLSSTTELNLRYRRRKEDRRMRNGLKVCEIEQHNQAQHDPVTRFLLVLVGNGKGLTDRHSLHCNTTTCLQLKLYPPSENAHSISDSFVTFNEQFFCS